MRIHIVVNNYSALSGGAELIVRRLHLGLLEKKIDSNIIGITKHKDSNMLKSHCLNLDNVYSFKAFIGLYQYIRQSVHSEDIVHGNLFPVILYLAIIKFLSRSKFYAVYTEHSTNNRRRSMSIGKLIDKFLYSQYCKIAAISEGVRESLINWIQSTDAKTEVIYNGIQLKFTESILRESRKCPTILSIGRLHKSKNYRNCLLALSLIKDVEFRYLIAGSGSEEYRLNGLIDELKLRDKVTLLGYVEDTKSLLLNSDIFLMPSKWEGFGLAAVEAMNASLPVITSDIPGLSEIADCKNKKKLAMIVDPDSPEAIANAVKILLKSFSKRQELGRAGFTRAIDFSEEKMIDDYIKWYSS